MKHPLHPATVHFPIACWAGSFFAEAFAYFSDAPEWGLIAHRLVLAGVLLALPAMCFGFVDYLKIANDHPAMKTASWHFIAMGTVWTLYVVLLFLGSGPTASPWKPLLSLVALLGLVLGGWLGAELVYGYGVGVRRGLPVPTRHDVTGDDTDIQ